jgi:HNH endonuclease
MKVPLLKLEDTRPIPGYTGYFAGPDGYIYSSVYRGGLPKIGPPKLAWRRLNGRPDRDGYMRVALVVDYGGRPRQRLVSRLVCAAFFGPSPTGKPEAQHKNGKRTDNRPSNLKWGAQKENADDRERHGNTARGSRNGSAVLSEDEVRRIKRGLRVRVPQKQLAEQFMVHKMTIQAIAAGRNWRWVR